MAELFSNEWVAEFAVRWNADKDMVDPLSAAGFSTVVAFGYASQEHPSVLFQVQDGKVTKASLFDPATSPAANWDLRAAPEQWAAWKSEGLGLAKLGVTVASGKLQFRSGDYHKMIRTPNLAAPFLRCFQLL